MESLLCRISDGKSRGKVFKYTLTGQTSSIHKFAYRCNKYFKYTVGDACESAVVSTAPTLPLDFESSTITYTFVDFDGGVVTKSLILIRLELILVLQ
jgi:hypothetical protein